MKRFIFLVHFVLCTLSTFAIDPFGARPVSEPSSEISILEIIFYIIGGIILVVFGIPFMYYSLKSEKKEDKNFGCFMLVGFIAIIAILVATCS